ncbi:MAG: DUF308 domain-containing protein [Ruminococcus sp.]|nr:DUF308 domain-containing protein [Ruminococcus sp.]
MKADNSGFIAKGLAYLICGVLIGFFPGIISWIFYIIGGIIILSSVLMLITGASSGMDGTLVGGTIAGIIVGVIVLLLPRIISVGIPIAAGIIFIISGVSRLYKSIRAKEDSGNLKTAGIVFGALLTAFGGFLLFNPFKASRIICLIIGLMLIALSVLNFYAAHLLHQRNKNAVPDTIDV